MLVCGIRSYPFSELHNNSPCMHYTSSSRWYAASDLTPSLSSTTVPSRSVSRSAGRASSSQLPRSHCIVHVCACVYMCVYVCVCVCVCACVYVRARPLKPFVSQTHTHTHWIRQFPAAKPRVGVTSYSANTHTHWIRQFSACRTTRGGDEVDVATISTSGSSHTLNSCRQTFERLICKQAQDVHNEVDVAVATISTSSSSHTLNSCRQAFGRLICKQAQDVHNEVDVDVATISTSGSSQTVTSCRQK
jgi:phosphoheptose isomerase